MPPAGKKLSRKGNVPLMLEMARAAAAGCGEGEGPGALLPLALLLVELRKGGPPPVDGWKVPAEWWHGVDVEAHDHGLSVSEEILLP